MKKEYEEEHTHNISLKVETRLYEAINLAFRRVLKSHLFHCALLLDNFYPCILLIIVRQHNRPYILYDWSL